MSEKPELIIFSQFLLGGGASFHRNMLANMPPNNFDIKVIYYLPKYGDFTRSSEFYPRPNDVIFEYGENFEGVYSAAFRLAHHISDRPGAIVANLALELHSLRLFPKKNKTVYFICHDDGFLPLVKKFHDIIDVFIAHNSDIFAEIKRIVPERTSDVFFIPHGVMPQQYDRNENLSKNIKVAFVARHHNLKGLYDLIDINQLIRAHGLSVDWLVMGDGPERENFISLVNGLGNFNVIKPDTNEGVIEELKKADIFILPSRKDGLPVALLEAMSVGCVPIVSNFSAGIKNVVTKEIGFVLDIGNNFDFAQTILKLHSDRSMLKRLSDCAYNAIKSDFDIRDQSSKYFSLYADFKDLKKVNNNLPKLLLKIKYLLTSTKPLVILQRLLSKILVQLGQR